MAAPNRGEAVQKQIQQDWVNREYIEIITISIKKITDFLNSFGKLHKKCVTTNINKSSTFLRLILSFETGWFERETDDIGEED